VTGDASGVAFPRKMRPAGGGFDPVVADLQRVSIDLTPDDVILRA